MAYTMWLEELQRRIDIETQAALMARMFGQDVPVPDGPALRRRFDEMLSEEPRGLSMPTSRTELLLEAFGRRG